MQAAKLFSKSFRGSAGVNRQGSEPIVWHAFIEITGKIFGRWFVEERAENNKHGHAQFLCLCDCGTSRVVRSADLRNGASQSCGCLTEEKASARMTERHALARRRKKAKLRGAR